jgi:hypothetical protein
MGPIKVPKPEHPTVQEETKSTWETTTQEKSKVKKDKITLYIENSSHVKPLL